MSSEFSHQLNKLGKTYQVMCEDCRLRRYDLKHSCLPINANFWYRPSVNCYSMVWFWLKEKKQNDTKKLQRDRRDQF